MEKLYIASGQSILKFGRLNCFGYNTQDDLYQIESKPMPLAEAKKWAEEYLDPEFTIRYIPAENN